MSMAQMSVKLISKGAHRKADVVGMIMAQLSMKAAIKKWGQEAEYAIRKEMKQFHWRDSYKPKHWHELTKKQKEQILESHEAGWINQGTKGNWWQQATRLHHKGGCEFSDGDS
jgi:hypothetical protein